MKHLEPHPLAAMFPLLPDEDLKALAESIAEHGQRQTILIFEGKILDGRHRYLACQIAGVEADTREWIGSYQQASDLVWDLNAERRHLSSQQRAGCWEWKRRHEADHAAMTERLASEAAERQRAAGAAGAAGAEHGIKGGRPRKTPLVRGLTKGVSEAVPHPKRPRDNSKRAAAVEARLANTNRDYISRSRKLDTAALEAVKDGYRPLIPKAHVSNNSCENEWYTPAEFIEAARRVLGAFDLDPASSAKANETVKAAHYYTKDDDGASKLWSGRVWMNPPYEGGLIDRFAAKLVASLPHITAITLTNNATDTKWFQAMARASSAICLLAGRVRFLSPTGERGAPLQGQAMLYFGDDVGAFAVEFEKIGVVYRR